MRLRSAALALFLPVALAAQDTTKTDPRAAMPERPTVATHASTVARGFLEVEAGAEFNKTPSADRYTHYTVVTKFGLAPRLQLSFGFLQQQVTHRVTATPSCPPLLLCAPLSPGLVSGLGDTRVSLKWRIADDDATFGDFALQPSIKLATGGSAVGSNTTDAGLLLISSRDVGPVHIDLNVGASAPIAGNGNRSDVDGVWTASFGGVLSGQLGWTAELFGFTHKGTGPDVGFLAGPTWAITQSAILDIGVIRRVGGAQPDAVFAGLTWNAGRLW